MSHEFRLGHPFLFQPVDEENWVKLYIVLWMIRTTSLASKKIYATEQGWWEHNCRRYAEADDRLILDATTGDEMGRKGRDLRRNGDISKMKSCRDRGSRRGAQDEVPAVQLNT